jgi:hypothetical protein
MPGSNNGTGQPLAFQCSQCRKRNYACDRAHLSRTGYLDDCTFTGRSKHARRGGIRRSRKAWEYRCRACRHSGWSSHIQAERAAFEVLRAAVEKLPDVTGPWPRK